MYRPFRLEEFDPNTDSSYYKSGKASHLANQGKIFKSLNEFIDDGKINGSELIDHWFPEIDADVFISHAHKDQDAAFVIAGILEEELGISSFIDSSAWGYSNNLLKEIDDEHSWIEARGFYDYGRRNGTTSHIHMMLATSLARMMDNTECAIFISSPNSIQHDQINSTTSSPWLFYELMLMKFIRERIPERHKKIVKKSATHNFSEGVDNDLNLFYHVDFDSLTEISLNTFGEWIEQWQDDPETENHSLDFLYRLTLKEFNE